MKACTAARSLHLDRGCRCGVILMARTAEASAGEMQSEFLWFARTSKILQLSANLSLTMPCGSLEFYTTSVVRGVEKSRFDRGAGGASNSGKSAQNRMLPMAARSNSCALTVCALSAYAEVGQRKMKARAARRVGRSETAGAR